MSDRVDRFEARSREFLTWLWFESERGLGSIELDGVGKVGVAFTRRLTLDATGGSPDGNTVSADAPGEAEEARTSLRLGKQVANARLLLDLGERHFELSVNASTFVMTGVKLPTLLQTGEQERLAERMMLIEEVESIFDGLFLQFARRRMDAAAWGEVRSAMHQWATRPVDV